MKLPKEDEDPDDDKDSEDKDPDDKDSEDKEPNDKDPNDKETEDGDKTPGEGDEKDDGTQDGENGDGTDGETPGDGTGDGDSDGSGDNGETDGTGSGENGGTGSGENDSTGGGTSEDSGNNDSTEGSSEEASDSGNTAMGTEGGGSSAASEENGGGNTETMSTDGGTGTDDTAPEASDSASGRASAGFSIETGSFVMPLYASENPQDGVKAGTLTDDTAAQTDTDTDTQEKTVIIEDITWESAPSYDGDTEGVYTFTPVLPEGYALSEGAELPKITVTVAEDDTQAEELRVLMELLRALPEPEEYLTYDEAADAVIEHEDMIDEEQLEEAREAADAYLDRYPVAETADSADTDSVSLAALLARLEGLEHIRDTVADCVDFDCPYHYPQFVQERMAQDETPELLTLEDLVEDYGVEEPVTPAVQTYGGRARAAAYAAPTQGLWTGISMKRCPQGAAAIRSRSALRWTSFPRRALIWQSRHMMWTKSSANMIMSISTGISISPWI